MSKSKKGVSAEEKRSRMLQLFYEKKDFFQLKELEKIAPKEKGIIVQSVKDVVQSLVDDGLVDTDKIGTSIYFWAYPSKAKNLKERTITELTEKIEEATKKLTKAQADLVTAQVGKEVSEERSALLSQLEQLKARKENLLKEIQKYKENDPAALEEMTKEAEKAREAANRWTDNIFAIKSWSKNKFMIEGATMDKQFGIPADLDYI